MSTRANPCAGEPLLRARVVKKAASAAFFTTQRRTNVRLNFRRVTIFGTVDWGLYRA